MLVEIGLPNHRMAHFSQEGNCDNLRSKLYLLEEKQEVVNLRTVAYQQHLAWYYNSKVKNRIFGIRDLVLRKVMQNT